MSFIKTFSGKHFYYDKINKDDIVINDIAVSLSNICRFAGHLSHFYSVAQHAVLCSQLVPQEFAFEALMHDATEAYCQDIPAPLKRLLPDYKRMEEKIDAVIREKYGLPPVMSTPRRRHHRNADVCQSRWSPDYSAGRPGTITDSCR